MPGPTKRTRQDDHLDNTTTTTSSSTSSSSASTPTTPTPPVTRNSAAHAHTDNTTTGIETGTPGPSAGTPRRATASSSHNTTTTTTTSTSNRPILTRSAATQAPSPRNTGLTRSTSLLNVTTRRSGLTATSSLPGIMAAPTAGAGPSSSSSGSSSSSARVGMLTRTQSTPSLVSPTQLKAAASAGGSGGAAGKGGDEGGSGGPGGRRFGKGKENIPPKKDEENEPEEGSSRKRPRMSSRASTSGRNGRGRSGSVVSVRSETSGRHSSLAPSSSASSIASWSARLPSPAPSQASSAAQTADTATSIDPLDMLRDEDDFDLDKTPTKSRPVTRSTVLPPTPPPSSPSLRDAEITERVGLMRVQSDKTETGDDVHMGEEAKERKSNPYKQLKAFLRLSSIPSSSETVTSVDQVIIGREEEKATLRSYLANRNDVDVGMYVSGPPGTGKTALVTALGRQTMEEEGWKVVELGCMGLKTTDIWRRLGEELACGKTERDVKEYLKQDDAKVFFILDEVDSLMPPPPSIAPPATSHLLTKLFSLPLTSPTIKLIAISNTLDLTLRARLVLPDSAQPGILPFKAYGATEMAPIVSARLASANVEGVKVDQTAVMLLTKKVEAQNGDLRMCLGVLSSAITLAEAEWIKKTSIAASTEPGKVVPMTKVAVTHILKALTSYTQQLKAAAGSGSNSTSATGKKIRSVQLQGKMVLVSILIFLARTRAGLNGCPAIGSGNITPPLTPGKSTSALSADLTASSLYATYSHLLSHATSPLPPAAESDYRDLLSNLETLGLISIVGATSSAGMTRTSSGRHKASGAANGGGKVELCVREDEVRDGLGLVDGQQKGIAEEEVKRVWEREEGKVRRVREKAVQVAEAAAAGQEGAEGYF
ncbi:hypothetical protein IAT40_004489 [Kwoniella sp. CBS 6097]